MSVETNTHKNIIIKIECPDKKGIVSTIAHTIHETQGNIITLREHVEQTPNETTAQFFARVECVSTASPDTIQHNLTCKVEGTKIQTFYPCKKKIIIFATHEYHCLGDLLLRNMHNDFNAQIVAVVSNRTTLEPLCNSFDMPFFHVPYEKTMTREDHEHLLQEVLTDFDFEYIVLARYMRILSESFVNKYPEHIINIHHSFLPAFIGANPYKQAHNRGVKIIGATAHFVNKDLDEGPIISQEVLPVDHTYNATKMKNAGRNVERIALSRAIELVFDDRVFICGNKTIIL